MKERHKIVVVGGGAGGLALVTKLGDTIGKRGDADITLIDPHWTHIWKPLLHEIASGTIDAGEHQLEYLAQARNHSFRFRLGRVESVDRENKLVWVSPNYSKDGVELTPRRSFQYDTLVLSIGSQSNDFGIDGVDEHCLSLNTLDDAKEFQGKLLNAMLRAHANKHANNIEIERGVLDIAVVGAGATGVELIAQLHHATRVLSYYGLDGVNPDVDIKFHLIEAGERVLPALPLWLSSAVHKSLQDIGVHVHLGEQVIRVLENGIETKSGAFIPSCIKVWAAGVKGYDVARNLGGINVSRNNQVEVNSSLQSVSDESIFAIGDCALTPSGDGFVPPRAQAAHQQAMFLHKALLRKFDGKPLGEFVYRDYGSLVTLGSYSTVGSLMGNLKGSIRLSGLIARIVYLSLHLKHQASLHGYAKALLMSVFGFFRRTVDPKIKLH